MKLLINPEKTANDNRLHELPPSLQNHLTSWTGAVVQYVEIPTGHIFIQELNLKKFSVFVWRVQTSESAKLYAVCHKPTIALQFTNGQDIPAVLAGFGNKLLEQKTFQLFYAPQGTNELEFQAGVSESMHFELRDGYLKEISQTYPEIRELLGRLRESSKLGIPLWPAPIDYTITEILNNARNCRETGLALSIDIQIYILQLLRAYIKKIAQEEKTKKAPANRGLVFQIRNHILQEPNIKRHRTEHLARAFHISITALKNDFKILFGTSIGSFVRHHALARAKLLLVSSTHSIDTIADETGYEHTNNFSRAFRSQFGQTPSEFRAKIK